MSAVIETFCVFRYSVMLRRKTCDLVKSFLAQKASTVASIVFGSRKPVIGLASFNVSSLLLTVHSIILVLQLLSIDYPARAVYVAGLELW